MNRHVKAPDSYDISHDWVFLAGTIDNGNSIDWQTETANWIMDNTKYGVLNPRRDNWDPKLAQIIDCAEFKEQVLWELDGIERSDKILFYIGGESLSPISLLELGLVADSDKSVFVCCEADYWRRGNVEVVCERYAIPLWDDLQVMLKEVFE